MAITVSATGSGNKSNIILGMHQCCRVLYAPQGWRNTNWGSLFLSNWFQGLALLQSYEASEAMDPSSGRKHSILPGGSENPLHSHPDHNTFIGCCMPMLIYIYFSCKRHSEFNDYVNANGYHISTLDVHVQCYNCVHIKKWKNVKVLLPNFCQQIIYVLIYSPYNSAMDKPVMDIENMEASSPSILSEGNWLTAESQLPASNNGPTSQSQNPIQPSIFSNGEFPKGRGSHQHARNSFRTQL